MRVSLIVGLAALAAGLAGCATRPVAMAPMMPAAAATPAASAHDQLFQLFKDDDEATLKLNPMSAIYRGDLRYADQFGDTITDAWYDASRRQLEASLTRLHAMDRAGLHETDQLAYDVFEYSLKDSLEAYSPHLLALTKVRPLNHFYGMQSAYPTFASGKGGAPFNTLADYDNNLKRHAGYVVWIDRAIGRFREGEAAGVVETKMTIRNVIEQLDNELRQKPEESQYYGPALHYPASFTAADKARLTAATRAAIVDQLHPATKRLRDFLANEYLGHARDGVGEMYMKGGDQLYRYQIRSTTTLPLTPEEIHQLGLTEVARITEGFRGVQREVGFTGSLAQFFDYMRTSPKFQPKSRQQLNDDYYALGKAVEAKIPAYFSTIPKSKLAIRPYDPTIEKFQAGGSYEAGTPDGSRPGTFYFNAFDLPSRSTFEETTLFLHEGEPGHHFQISLAQENEALPPFMRFGGNTAFAEGWALYAETLGYDMGFYKDPLSALRDTQRRDAAGDAAGGRHRHPCPGLDPRTGDCLHAGPLGDGQDRRHRRGRALHCDPEPGDRLQGRRADHPEAAQEGRGRARPEVRHPRLPCTGADDRGVAADHPRGEDRPLDRGDEGGVGAPALLQE